MTAARLMVGAGAGRLLRRDGVVLFDPTASEPTVADVFVAAANAAEAVVAVKQYLIDGGFSAAPLVLARWADAHVDLLVFGVVQVHTSAIAAPMVSGAGSTTWIERHLGSVEMASATEVDLRCGTDAGAKADPATDLQAGIVQAGAFRLSLIFADAPAAGAASHGASGAVASESSSDSAVGVGGSAQASATDSSHSVSGSADAAGSAGGSTSVSGSAGDASDHVLGSGDAAGFDRASVADGSHSGDAAGVDQASVVDGSHSVSGSGVAAGSAGGSTSVSGSGDAAGLDPGTGSAGGSTSVSGSGVAAGSDSGLVADVGAIDPAESVDGSMSVPASAIPAPSPDAASSVARPADNAGEIEALPSSAAASSGAQAASTESTPDSPGDRPVDVPDAAAMAPPPPPEADMASQAVPDPSFEDDPFTTGATIGAVLQRDTPAPPSFEADPPTDRGPKPAGVDPFGQATGAAAATRGGLVEAAHCRAGHANPPRSVACYVCGLALLDDQSLGLIEQPAVGRIVFSGGQEVALDTPVKMGRKADGESDAHPVIIDHVEVSRSHASIAVQGWTVLLTDEGSRNGTWVTPANDPTPVRLEPHVPHVLEHGATVHLGGPEVSFTYHFDNT